MALAMVFPFAARAHDPPTAPVRDLGTVTIVGGQPTSLPTQIPTTIEGVTRQQIEESVNASDSEDALKYLPSLLVRKRYVGDYNHAVMSTRASGTGNSARSLVYADGILLANLLGNGATFAPRWMMVTPEEIERVDVLYGPFSAAYPGNSVGAVVDFVTRMPTRFEAHGKLSVTHEPFDLYSSRGTFGSRQASAAAGNRAGPWVWWFDVDRTVSDGQPLTFATRTLSQRTLGSAGVPVSGAAAGLNRSNQFWWLLGDGTQYRGTQDHAKVRLAYDLSPVLRASYLLGWWHNDSQGRSSTYLHDAAGLPVAAGAVNIDGRAYTLAPASDFPSSSESLTHVMQGVSIKSHTHGLFDWEIAASRYDYVQDVLRAPTTGTAGRIVDGHGTGWDTLALKITWRPRETHVVDAGLQRDSYRWRSVERATADWVSGEPGALNQSFRGDTRLTSLYAQDTWRFAQHWKAMLGARLERWEAFDGQTANATTAIDHASRSRNFLSPKAALARQLNDLWVLKASLGRAVRMPTVSELFQGGIAADGTLINNDPNLRPEKSWTSEISAERQGDRSLWRVTAFFERTRDALYSQTNVTVTPNVTNIQNVDAVRTHGLETAWQGSDVAVKGLDLAASATWTDSRVTRDDKFPAAAGHWQPRVPQWRASTVATWHASPKWTHTLGVRYSGRQYSTLDNSDPNGFAYQGASRYFTADWRTLYRIDKHWTAALGIDNLNNQKYWNFHPYPQRTYTMELKVDL
jgi:iron complex outermembrane receptor protein